MESAQLIRFLNKQKHMDEKNYLISTIAFSAAPTLLHNKPSSLISFRKGKRNLYHVWERYKDEVSEILDLAYFELQKTASLILVMFYNKIQLQSALLDRENAGFLYNLGYPEGVAVDEALARLNARMQDGFPHEIGVFLGYPLDDIIGFIENSGKEYLLCKYWKVYRNPERAKYLFDTYDRARIQIIDAMNFTDGSLALKFAHRK